MNLVFYWQTAVCAEIEIVSPFFPSSTQNPTKMCCNTLILKEHTHPELHSPAGMKDENWVIWLKLFSFRPPARVGLGRGEGSSKDNTISDAAAAHCPGMLDRCWFMLPDEGDRCNFVDSWVLLNFLMEFLS